jgi:hypothetical protein
LPRPLPQHPTDPATGPAEDGPAEAELAAARLAEAALTSPPYGPHAEAIHRQLVAELTTVIMPTLPEREGMRTQAISSIRAAGFTTLMVEFDHDREGPAELRNRMAERATTPWLLFVDDDDWLQPSFALTVAPFLAGADVVSPAWELHYTPGGPKREGPQPLDRFDPGLLEWQNFIPVTAMVRASAFHAAGGFPLGKAEEDWALWQAMAKQGARFVCVPQIAWTYRQHPDSRSVQHDADRHDADRASW